MDVGNDTVLKPEVEPIALSALQHHLFCPRQCALIHVEQAWAENQFTAEGRLMHETTSAAGHEVRRGVHVVTAMPLASARLGVAGIADLVELHHSDDGVGWQPFPVEYKRGKPKAHRADEVQLCAQAICLEEMFQRTIAEGALFYGKTRRRMAVTFDEELRALTATVATEARALIAAGTTPKPVYQRSRCSACSLAELCRPKRLQRDANVSRWLARRIADDTDAPGETS
ncbi:MAG: CRISPR-associated protein Cas4 [Pseudomonadota bacterium]